jgi:hypothetical protein
MTPSEIEAAKGQIHLAFSEALSIALTEAFRENANHLSNLEEAYCMVDMVFCKMADGETLSDDDAKEYEDNLLVLAALALVEVAIRRQSGLIKEWANCLRTFADLAESFCPIEKAANAQSQIEEPERSAGDEMTAASAEVSLTPHKINQESDNG